MTNFDHAYQAVIAALFRRRNVALADPLPVITLDPSEYAVLSDLTAAKQTGRLPAVATR